MKKVEHEYLELKTMLASMCKITTSMLHDAIRALVERDSTLAKEVILRDDKVDALDSSIDEQCLKILALYEPKAIDLRFIVTVLRIIVDLERVGDHCTKIAQEAIKLNQSPPVKPYIDLPRMAGCTVSMLEDAVSAFFQRDVDAALEIINRDDEVDTLDKKIMAELFNYINDDPDNNRNIIALMMITRSIERIADYATNVGEVIYFMQTGEIIKHRLEDKGLK